MNCPLCHSRQTYVIRTLTTRTIIQGWWDTFQIDITNEVAGTEQITLHECRACKLQFFSPQLVGSQRIYAALQRLEGYYVARKWEQDFALRDMRRGDRVLDIGCGTGDFVERLIREQQINADGIEFNEEAVAEAQSHGRPVHRMRLEELEPGSYDVVCAFQVLEHVPDPDVFVRQAIRVLRQDGRLILCVPNREAFLKYIDLLLDMPPHHMTRWSRQCFVHMGNMLGLRLGRVACEPLTKTQVPFFFEAYTSQLRRKPYGRFVANKHTLGAFRYLLDSTSLNRLMRGQALYVSYIASQDH